jgi:hypothetical protein
MRVDGCPITRRTTTYAPSFGDSTMAGPFGVGDGLLGGNIGDCNEGVCLWDTLEDVSTTFFASSNRDGAPVCRALVELGRAIAFPILNSCSVKVDVPCVIG